MNIKNLNELFGNLLIVIGATKVISIFLILINAIGIITGSSNTDVGIYNNIKNIIGVAELIAVVGSIVMLVKNNKNETGVTQGYKYALLGALTEFLNIFQIIGILIGIAVSMQYIKAGNRIKSDNFNYYPQKNNKEMLKRTEWFYSGNNEKMEKELFKYTQKKEKIDEEILAWENLVSTGEITEEIFLQETKKLMEKSKKLEEQINKYNLINKNKLV